MDKIIGPGLNCAEHLLHCLTFYAAVYNSQFSAVHVPGVHNTAAEALSRENASRFSLMFPQVHQVAIPQVVQDLLVSVMPNWGSREWTALFMTSWIGGSQSLPEQCTRQDGSSTSSSARLMVIPHFPSPKTLHASSQQ